MAPWWGGFDCSFNGGEVVALNCAMCGGCADWLGLCCEKIAGTEVFRGQYFVVQVNRGWEWCNVL